jgi:hypothetical protein
MNPDTFTLVEQAFEAAGSDAAFAVMIQALLEAKEYQLVLEARLMRKRHEMGLPLIFAGTLADIPPERQEAYRLALVEAAREAGSSYLAAGDIARAWRYFRAIDDTAPVAAALDVMDSPERIDDAIAVALFEGANPRKGFELLLEHHGVCRGIDFVIGCPDREMRLVFLRTLVREFSRQLASHLKEAIAGVEGDNPSTDSVAQLIAGREWLFENCGFYIENSHLASILRASVELDDPATMRLALELSEYAQRLDPIHCLATEPPFENPFVDPAKYLRALLGENVDDCVAHFEAKIDRKVRGAPEALVALLSRLRRYEQAIQISMDHLNGQGSGDCPSAIELCQVAGDYEWLRDLARNKRDLLGFAAGLVQLNHQTKRVQKNP